MYQSFHARGAAYSKKFPSSEHEELNISPPKNDFEGHSFAQPDQTILCASPETTILVLSTILTDGSTLELNRSEGIPFFGYESATRTVG